MPHLNEKNNVGWIDALRVIACLMVVFSHCCDPFVAHFDANREMFLTGVFSGSLVRPCVPLFAMMTAVLLLPIKSGTTINQFYRKRIGRIVPPLVFWSIALPLMANSLNSVQRPFIFFSFLAITVTPLFQCRNRFFRWGHIAGPHISFSHGSVRP